MAKRARSGSTARKRDVPGHSPDSAVDVPARVGSETDVPSPFSPAGTAVAIFERGMSALQRHAFGDAASVFRDLLIRFPAERALLDRARVYLDLCDREARRRPAPQTIEERLTAATAALNDNDAPAAEGLIKAVLAEDPRQDCALYLFAALEARRGNPAAAVERLEAAIRVSPEAAAQARLDPDFESLRGNDAFRRLTNRIGPNGTGRGRHPPER
jgi:tetratricopeptide (TPR) repeat protein